MQAISIGEEIFNTSFMFRIKYNFFLWEIVQII